MPGRLLLRSAPAVRDLAVYLERAARVQEGSTRLIAADGVLAVYTAILYPAGLTDTTPTVLGLRTFGLEPGDDVDEVVPIRSLADRLARLRDVTEEPVALEVPHSVGSVTWAGIAPPRGGWLEQESVPAARLRAVADVGIAEMARAVPDAVGEQLLQKARAQVWGASIEGLEYLPTGAAFAALTLGFLDDVADVAVYSSGPWLRLTTVGGHVLVRHRAWTLKR